MRLMTSRDKRIKPSEDERTSEFVVVDASRYKKVKKALQESEERYRLLFENIPAGVFRITVDGKILDANPALISMLGYSTLADASILGMEKDKKIFRQTWREFRNLINSQGEIKGFDVRWQKKDGSSITIRVNAKLIADNAGKTLYYEGTVEDISERLKTEKALKDNEQRFRTLVANLPGAVYRCLNDEEWTMLFLSKAIEEISGYPAEDFIRNRTRSFASIIHPDDRELLDQKVQEGLTAGRFYTYEYRIINRQGDCRWVYEKGQGVYDAAGILLWLDGAIFDVTERKRAEEALRESEERYRSLVDTFPETISVHCQGKILYINSAGCRMLGAASPEELLGRSLFDFLHPDSQELVGKRVKQLQKEMKPLEPVEEKFVRLDGRVIDVEVTASLVFYSGKACTQVVARDISLRKQAEEKLLAYQEKLRSLASELTLLEERERRQVAADLHDHVSQALAISKLKIEALRKHHLDAAVLAELEEIRRLIEGTIQDTRSLIFDLSPPILYELGLKAALEWLAERIQEQSHIAIDFEGRGEMVPLANDIQVILFQTVRELLMNVAKHSKANQAKVTMQQESDQIKIVVKDNGVGFDSSLAFPSRKNGNGFGFFSVHERLRYVGGGLDIQSKPGRGSKIVITAPLKPSVRSEKQDAHAK